MAIQYVDKILIYLILFKMKNEKIEVHIFTGIGLTTSTIDLAVDRFVNIDKKVSMYHILYVLLCDTNARLIEMIHIDQLPDLAQPENVGLIITQPRRLLL